jgi:hypothetical protein
MNHKQIRKEQSNPNEIIFRENVKTNEILSEIFSRMPNLNYWSYDALRELYLGSLQMVRELGGMVSKKTFYYIPATLEEMLVKMYDIILAGDNLPRLHKGIG